MSWRCMPTFIAIVVCCAAQAVVGWRFGFRALPTYIAFWALAALAVLAARTAVARTWGVESRANAIVRCGVAAFAIVVVCGLALGAARALTLTGYLTAQLALAGAAFALPAVAPSQTPVDEPFQPPSWVVGTLAALAMIAVAFALAHAPFTLYDSLSYHLFFAARWLQDHALSILATPFSDEAQAYAPGNGELFFLWLMLPFHGDLLARFGQFPFAILAAAALYALARRLGASPAHAIYPPAFLLLSRPIVEQAVGANVDLICASTFLTSLYLGIAAVDRGERSDWTLFGISAGLYLGTKYLALVYAPLLILVACARGPRARMAWAIPGVVVLAAPWYLRNWIVAGSPIYPASLALGGLTLAQGAFSRSAMLNTVFHTADVRLAPVLLAHAFGPTLWVVWLPAWLMGAPAMARRGWWPHGFLCLAPMLMAGLFWFGLPVNIDSRFLLPAVGPALLPLAFAFRRDPRWNSAVHALYLAAMVGILVGASVTIPATLPWFMRDWLALDGLVGRPFLPIVLMLAAALAAMWRMRDAFRRWALPAITCVMAGTTTVLAVGPGDRCDPTTCRYLNTTSPYVRAGMLTAWQWMSEHVHDATIGNTGNNLPYPLTGERLTNRVCYVNIDGRPRWRFHDYDRAYREGRFTPEAPMLAQASGELLPVRNPSHPDGDAVRPRYERMQGIPDAWIFNLQRMHVDFLFVSTLSMYELEYQWHTSSGFPIEDAWASANPGTFQLAYENAEVRVYAVAHGEGWR